MIVPAIIARITSKYFRIASVFYGLAMPKSTANTNEESSSPVSTMRISSAMPNPVRKVPEGLARKEVPYRGPGSYRGGEETPPPFLAPLDGPLIYIRRNCIGFARTVADAAQFCSDGGTRS